jgi:hypothetical protein
VLTSPPTAAASHVAAVDARTPKRLFDARLPTPDVIIIIIS